MHFHRYLAGVATFCPLNSRIIKRSRALEQSDQAIKDQFCRSRFLIPVANASTGDVNVTTPCCTLHLYSRSQPLPSLDPKPNPRGRVWGVTLLRSVLLECRVSRIQQTSSFRSSTRLVRHYSNFQNFYVLPYIRFLSLV